MEENFDEEIGRGVGDLGWFCGHKLVITQVLKGEKLTKSLITPCDPPIDGELLHIYDVHMN